MTVLMGGGNVKAWELIQQIKENRKEQRWKKGDIVKNQHYKPLEIIDIEDPESVIKTHSNCQENLINQQILHSGFFT